MLENQLIIETLKRYRKLTNNPQNHNELLKEKTVLLYTATLLESRNTEILTLCLDILEDLTINGENNQRKILKTYGVLEALESLSIRTRDATDGKCANRASKLAEILKFSSTASHSTYPVLGKKRDSLIYHLLLTNLQEENLMKFEEALVEICGIISFVTDVVNKRCTVRIGRKINIRNVVSKILVSCGVTALLIRKYPGEDTELATKDNLACSTPPAMTTTTYDAENDEQKPQISF